MRKHESRCTNNPNRVCGICGETRDFKELVKLVPDPERFKTADEFGEYYSPSKEYDNVIVVVRETVDYCPVCTFSTLRQSSVPMYLINLDLKKELEEYWIEQNKDEEYY